MIYKAYLLKKKKGVFYSLLAEDKLYQHCAEVEKQAVKMFDLIVEHMKEAEGVTKQFKEENQMKWVQRMGNIQHRATKIVCDELIYV